MISNNEIINDIERLIINRGFKVSNEKIKSNIYLLKLKINGFYVSNIYFNNETRKQLLLNILESILIGTNYIKLIDYDTYIYYDDIELIKSNEDF